MALSGAAIRESTNTFCSAYENGYNFNESNNIIKLLESNLIVKRILALPLELLLNSVSPRIGLYKNNSFALYKDVVTSPPFSQFLEQCNLTNASPNAQITVINDFSEYSIIIVAKYVAPWLFG